MLSHRCSARLKGLPLTLGILVAAFGAGCGASKSAGDDAGGGSGGKAGTAGAGGAAGAAGTGGSGGAAGTSSGGSDGGAGSEGGAGGGGPAPGPHRPQAVACPATHFGPDAGTVSCTQASDCATDAGGLPQFCVQHACTIDACLSDQDCPATSVCGCASDFGGNAIHTNRCVPTACHVDADCASGFCSPARTTYCPSLTGYHCRDVADTCHVDSDCHATTDGGIVTPYSCQYAAEVGHWQCAPTPFCAG